MATNSITWRMTRMKQRTSLPSTRKSSDHAQGHHGLGRIAASAAAAGAAKTEATGKLTPNPKRNEKESGSLQCRRVAKTMQMQSRNDPLPLAELQRTFATELVRIARRVEEFAVHLRDDQERHGRLCRWLHYRNALAKKGDGKPQTAFPVDRVQVHPCRSRFNRNDVWFVSTGSGRHSKGKSRSAV